MTGATTIQEDEEENEGEGELGLVEMGRRKVEERRIREVIVEDWEGRLEDVSPPFLTSRRHREEEMVADEG